MKKMQVFKLTDEDWYPSFKLAGYYQGKKGLPLISVAYLELSRAPGELHPQYRVCIWGADDFGMKRDYHCELAALEMFHLILQQDVVRTSFLKEHGFGAA